MKLNLITLTFPKKEEKEYQKDFLKNSLVTCRLALLVSALLYAAFGFLDSMVYYDDLRLFAIIRFGVVIPFMLLVIALSFTKVFIVIWQHMLFAAYVIAGAGIILMIGKYPDDLVYYMGLILIFFGGYFFIKLQFLFATIAGLVVLALFNLMLSLTGNLQSLNAVAGNFFFVSANIIGVVGLYYMEVSNRKNFILTKMLNQKKSELEEINKSLEQIVESRTSELQRSEERYKLLAENAFDGIYLFNGNYFEYVNKQFCKITEYSYEELTADFFDFNNILTEESKKIVQQRIEFRKKGFEVPSLYEFQIVTKSGKIKDVEVNTSALKRDNSPFILGIMRDITEYKKTKKLESEVMIAKQSANFKQNFLANMSHEIRTPLTGIIGLIEIMQKEPLSPRLQEYVKILRNSSENLTEIIDQVLDFSKIEAGKVQLKPITFKLESLFENARVLFNNLCYKKDLKFNIIADKKLPDTIRADEKKLSQIINNLLSNAVKFTEKGSVTLKAEIVARAENTDDVVIKIEIIDTGVGIPPEKQEKLFAPFAQIEEQDTRPYEGTGLGLSICKEIVNMHGGEIGVYSKYQEGSTFWFTFTAREAKTDMPVKQEKQKPAKVASKKLKILFAEDKIVNQKVVKLMLSSMGHEVELAKNGKQAIELYKPGKFDIILMDIQMPVMDGINATIELKKKYKNLPPVVGLSANAFEGDREKYMARGLDEYLTKPLIEEDFVRVVEKLGLGEEA